MVPIISSSEKLNARWISTLAFFSPELMFSVDSRATDIILEGREPILLGVAKMTLMTPIGGLEKVFPCVQDLDWSPYSFGRQKDVATFLLWSNAPNDSLVYNNPRWYVPALGGTSNKNFDYALKGPYSFCLATLNMAHSWYFPTLNVLDL